MSKKEGRMVAKVIKANGHLTDKALDAVWEIINKFNSQIEVEQLTGKSPTKTDKQTEV